MVIQRHPLVASNGRRTWLIRCKNAANKETFVRGFSLSPVPLLTDLMRTVEHIPTRLPDVATPAAGIEFSGQRMGGDIGTGIGITCTLCGSS